MKIIITPGKSGAILFFTNDGNFLIKTVIKSEYQFLQKNLVDYGNYMLNNENTLLVKFVGLYSCNFIFNN
jgi:1-phosphatidylinositol-4-phosphate 5-kinase